jgi:phosphate transport system protein
MPSTRQAFEHALLELSGDLLRIGGKMEESMARAVQSLVKQDQDLAQRVITGDQIVDDMQRDIEAQCLRLIATQQPTAKDLRRIVAALKIAIDLERMADHAVDIAKIALRIGDEPLIKPLIDIPRMAELVQAMVRNALNCYAQEDVDLANQLARDDDLVDHLHNQVFLELLMLMLEDSRTIQQGTQLLFVIRYLERIADHATNIGEEAIYQGTGERQELND